MAPVFVLDSNMLDTRQPQSVEGAVREQARCAKILSNGWLARKRKRTAMGLALHVFDEDVVELAVKDLEVNDLLATGGVSHAACR